MGTSYMLIEIIWRCNTYLAMGVVGAIAGVLIGLINEVFTWETPLLAQCLIGMIIATSLELISGCILNLGLHLNMWDYSNIPCNFLGQICLPFAIAWLFLSLIVILLDDFIRWKLFKEEKPHYIIF